MVDRPLEIAFLDLVDGVAAKRTAREADGTSDRAAELYREFEGELDDALRALVTEPLPVETPELPTPRPRLRWPKMSAPSGRSWWRRSSSRALLVAGVLLVVITGVSVAQRVLDADEAQPIEGVTNSGQPLEGVPITDMSPPDVAAIAAERGYAVRWQIEARQDTASDEDDRLFFEDAAPECGSIEGGSVIDEGRIQLVVVQDDPVDGSSAC